MEQGISGLKLNRTQAYLVDYFKEDLLDQEFEDLKFIVTKFFKIHPSSFTDKSDYYVKEMLKQSVIILVNKFFKLSFHYPFHKDVLLWNEKENEWRNYHTNIEKLHFENKEKLSKELENILDEIKNVTSVENQLEDL